MRERKTIKLEKLTGMQKEQELPVSGARAASSGRLLVHLY